MLAVAVDNALAFQSRSTLVNYVRHTEGLMPLRARCRMPAMSREAAPSAGAGTAGETRKLGRWLTRWWFRPRMAGCTSADGPTYWCPPPGSAW